MNFEAEKILILEKDTQEQNFKEIIAWVNAEVAKKNLPYINSIQELSSGNIFLEIISVYHPKKVDLTKTYFKPKDDYEILQNYKQLLSSFNKLGWKKFDPEKFRKRKDKDLLNMSLFLKKILNQHLFDNNESDLHTILNNIESPENSELLKTAKDFRKIEEKKHEKIINETPHQKQRESSFNKNTKELSHIKKSEKKLPIPSSHPPKPVNNGIKATTSENFRPKDMMTSPRLPPHPYHSSKNIVPTSNLEVKEEQELKVFENMRITKLEKEKGSLLRKILQIQQIVAKEKAILTKTNREIKILDENEYEKQNHTTDKQKETIDKIRSSILNIIGET